MISQADFDALARDYEYIASLLITANAKADKLHLTVPETVADVLTQPARVRAAGAAQGGPGWFNPTQETDNA